MIISKVTPSGSFKVTLESTMPDAPLLPPDLRELSRVLEELAAQIRSLTKTISTELSSVVN